MAHAVQGVGDTTARFKGKGAGSEGVGGIGKIMNDGMAGDRNILCFFFCTRGIGNEGSVQCARCTPQRRCM